MWTASWTVLCCLLWRTVASSGTSSDCPWEDLTTQDFTQLPGHIDVRAKDGQTGTLTVTLFLQGKITPKEIEISDSIPHNTTMYCEGNGCGVTVEQQGEIVTYLKMTDFEKFMVEGHNLEWSPEPCIDTEEKPTTTTTATSPTTTTTTTTPTTATTTPKTTTTTTPTTTTTAPTTTTTATTTPTTITTTPTTTTTTTTPTTTTTTPTTPTTTTTTKATTTTAPTTATTATTTPTTTTTTPTTTTTTTATTTPVTFEATTLTTPQGQTKKKGQIQEESGADHVSSVIISVIIVIIGLVIVVACFVHRHRLRRGVLDIYDRYQSPAAGRGGDDGGGDGQGGGNVVIVEAEKETAV